ncbi:MAG TPA: putative DNA-binding domain-containing protein [Xanthomonadales bacterium]|nr:putative DNA-binding domain-containing protein [Xanthomonadales bacterium]
MAEDFQQLQYAFAAHIRDPANNAAPEGIDDRRMAIYRELFYNNVEGLLANNFPVIRRITPDAQWHALVRGFYAGHASHTPLFTEIGREFHRYLQDRAARGEPDPPFLPELAHYEFVELALSLDETCIDDVPHDPEGDVVAGRPVVSPLAWPLVYAYDVQHVREDYQPSEPPPEPTVLVVVRNRADDVAFMAITPLTYRLLELLKEDPARTGLDAVDAIAAQFPEGDRAAVREAGAGILRGLRERDVLLGTAVG